MAKHPPRRPFTTVQLAQGWRELIPGIEFKRLCVDEQAGTKSFLLRVRAGMSLPEHTHQGYEECLVLEGEFSMGVFLLFVGVFFVLVVGSFFSCGLVWLWGMTTKKKKKKKTPPTHNKNKHKQHRKKKTTKNVLGHRRTFDLQLTES